MIRESMRRISFMYTLKCTIECQHCITLSSPRVKEKVDFDVAKKVLEEAIALDFRQLSFTGGEALIYKNEVFHLSRRARDAGMIVLVMTNGFWAQRAKAAESFAADMAEAGITHACISTDKYHVAAGLPFDAVVHGTRALRQHGIKTKVQYAREKVDEELDTFMRLMEPEDVVVEVFPVYAFGRAAKFERALLVTDDTAEDARCPFGPMIMPSGEVIKCCGGSLVSERAHGEHPALLGNIHHSTFTDITVRTRRGDDVLLTAFNVWGGKKLGMLLDKEFWTTQEKPPYQGMCDLCCRVLNDPERVRQLRIKLDTPEIRKRVDRQAQILDALDKDRDKEWETEWDYERKRARAET